VKFLNTTALAGLTQLDDPSIGKRVASAYTKFHPLDRPFVIEALVSRPSFAPALLEMLEKGVVARGDVSAAQARQIRALGDPDLTARLAAVWGEMRDSPADKMELINRLKRMLTPERLAAATPARGRHLFAKHCGACHRLFGVGGEIGPDLTGANRQNIDYVLVNVVDPSAVVTKDFLMTRFVLDDGRVLAGIVSGENETTLTVQTAQSRQTIAKGDIEIREPTQLSLMPDGLLQSLDEQEIVDLVAYLGADSQIHERHSVPGE
ncbi:MAG: c-type cytochrome, partial [Planctomycetia bacterium]